MAEKILNTRVLLKTDTLENWNKSTLPLKKGELALATVAASAGTGLSEPVVMIKVGEDGVKTFKDLEWNVYAKASDVVAAAKSEDALTAFINNVITSAGVATDKALSTLSGRVTTLEGLVGDTKVADQISAAITALDLANTYAAKEHAHVKADITDFEHTHTKEDITDFAHNHEISEVNGLQDALDGKEAAGEAAKVQSALNEYKTANDAAVAKVAEDLASEATTARAAEKANAEAIDAIEASIGTVAEGKTVVGMIAEAQTAATYDDTKVKEDIATLQGLVGDTEVATQISTAVAAEAEIARAAEKENADAIAVLNGTGEGSVSKQVADAVAGIVNGAPEAYDTLKEISDWIAAHPDSVSALNSAIQENAEAIEALEALVGTLPEGETDVVAYIQKIVAAEESRAKGVESGLDSRLQAVEAAVGESGSVAGDIADSLTEAKSYTDAEVKKLSEGAVATNAADIAALEGLVGDKSVATQITTAVDGLKNGELATMQGEIDAVEDRAADLEAKSHEHANKDLLDTYTQTEANLADAVAKKHEHANAAELAKFADGDKEKLDAAVQTVTAGDGLIATKSGTDVAIAFDDDTTWIFYCGDSTSV